MKQPFLNMNILPWGLLMIALVVKWPKQINVAIGTATINAAPIEPDPPYLSCIFGIVVALLAIQQIAALLKTLRSQESGTKAPGKPRAESQANSAALVKCLRARVFAMLSLSRDQQLEIMRQTTGKSLADETGIRQATVGKLIDLKWKQHTPAQNETLAQLLYILCTDERAFVIFEKSAKGVSSRWENKPDEELYRLIKNALRTGLTS